MSARVQVTVGQGAPLEIAICLVEAARRASTEKWQLHFTHETLSVLRETAFAAISELRERGCVQIHATATQFSGLNLSSGSQRCEVINNTTDPFDICLTFLQSVGASIETVTEIQALRKQRHTIVTQTQAHAAILIGTGPSLSEINLNDYNQALTFGCNKLFLLPYKFYPTHYVFEDRVVTEDIFSEQRDFGSATLWLPHDLSHLTTRGIRYCLDRTVTSFPAFSTSDSIAYSGWTVMYIMLQMAFWMGVREVFLVGVDGACREPPHNGMGVVRTSCGNDQNHFTADYYGSGSRYQRPATERVLESYELANEVFKKANRSIVNCSKGTHIECFVKGNLPAPEYFHAT